MASGYLEVFMALELTQVPYSDCNFCPSVGLSVPVLLVRALPDKLGR